jgi:DNA-binding PadR family transcriptional regulator
MPAPLGAQVFQILLSLDDADRHGYAIIADVAERTRGDMRLTASTLYAVLKRLLDRGWIEELAPPENETDPRRRYYRITKVGRAGGRAEAARLHDLTQMARAHDWLPRRRAR